MRSGVRGWLSPSLPPRTRVGRRRGTPSTSWACRRGIPAELGAEDGRHPRSDGRTAIGQLRTQPQPARQHVVDRPGQLVAGRPRHLGLEERPTRHQRPEQVLRLGQGGHGGRIGPVAGDEPGSRLLMHGRERRIAIRGRSPGGPARPGRPRRRAGAQPSSTAWHAPPPARARHRRRREPSPGRSCTCRHRCARPRPRRSSPGARARP